MLACVGQGVEGEDMRKSKTFTARQVKAIRKQYAEGNTITAIAEAYGRSRQAITDLVAGRTYQRVRDDIDAPALPGELQERVKTRND